MRARACRRGSVGSRCAGSPRADRISSPPCTASTRRALQRHHGARRTRDLRVADGARLCAAALSHDRSGAPARDSARHRSGRVPAAAWPDRDARARVAALHPQLAGEAAAAVARPRHAPERPRRCDGLAGGAAQRRHRCAAVDAGCARSDARRLHDRTRALAPALGIADAVAITPPTPRSPRPTPPPISCCSCRANPNRSAAP